MNEIKSSMIAEVLLENTDKASELLKMSPEEAVKVFNEKGCDVSKEDLVEFGKELWKLSEIAQSNDELDENSLAAVSGGCSRCFQAGLWTVAIGITVLGVAW